jgi:caa(3)-type oxidase subunit IV
MSGEVYKGHTKEYLIIFGILTALTVVELYIPGLTNVPHMTKGVLLTFFAALKAFFVGYFFMHLKEEKPWLKFIALIPLAAVIYAFALVLEGMYR